MSLLVDVLLVLRRNCNCTHLGMGNQCGGCTLEVG